MGSCKFILIFCFSLLHFELACQGNIDSLKFKSEKDLIESFYSNYDNNKFPVARIYSKEFLIRAKEKNDTILIADGYYFLSLLSKSDSSFLEYNDSIIQLTKNISIKNKYYPLIAYFNLGDYHYENKKFDLALDNYLLALKSKNNLQNKELFNETKHRIGLIKSRYGNDVEALELYKQVNDFYLKIEDLNQRPNNYLSTLFAISDAHLRLNELDSSLLYINKGIKESVVLNDTVLLNYFKFQYGLLEYKNGKYVKTIDRIRNTLPMIEKIGDSSNLMCGNYYLGKSYLKLGEIDNSIEKFIKVDDIYKNINDIHPDYRDSYEHLIEYFDSIEDLQNELKYVKTLLKVDKYLNNNHKTISSNLYEKYDTPKLLAEQAEIVKTIRQRNKRISVTIYVGIGVIILLMFYLFLLIQRKQKLQKQFNLLLNNSKVDISDSKKYNNEHSEGRKNISEIPEDLSQELLCKLNKFEEQKEYLNQSINLTTLAKKFSTNTKYLSSVINTNKGVNYSSYIGNLRVNYVVEKLKADKIFRNYTIKAIAEESGFGSTESFSKTFKKNTVFILQYL